VATTLKTADGSQPANAFPWRSQKGGVLQRVRGALSYLRTNRSLLIGLLLFSSLILFSVVGARFVDVEEARPISVRPLQPPSWELPFGSDKQGRNLFAVMVTGTPLTLRIGLVAGLIGVSLGALIGFVSAYYGGWLDALLRGIVDVGLTVPGLMILIIVAMMVRSGLSVEQMALVVASISWLYPARTIRAQVLTLRERSYVQVARLSGMPNWKVIFAEILPNMLPYLAASLVVSISAAVLASVGLEVLGLGPMDSPTIGMTLFWINYNAAVINGWWWWWLPPIIVIGLLFISLFQISIGLDEIANPRIRQKKYPAPPVAPSTENNTGAQPLMQIARNDVLRVENLSVHYDTDRGPVHAVENVSFALQPRERLGLVGESGSGKSSMALAIMRLLRPPGRIANGAIWLEDDNLLAQSEAQMKALRLAKIALVAQGSMNSLNPVMRIRDQIAVGLIDHDVVLPKSELDERIAGLLAKVGLPAKVAGMFPHELSGGMKQRVVIAIAISLSPRVIIADEPTSALDVVVQRQIMETLKNVQADIGAAVILVGHDMGLMAQFVQRVGVMYAGRLMEIAPVREIFHHPRHPYAQMLISSLPSTESKGNFTGIPGLPPSLLDMPKGCVFHARCPLAVDRCRVEVPALRELEPGVSVACHFAE
jgi:peptide/nickel transport system ATP-binding protein